MPSPFKVRRILSDADWGRFQELARDPRQTVDMQRSWLAARGCNVSRAATHRCAKDVRDRTGVGELWPALADVPDDGMRQRIGEAIRRLNGRELGIVTMLAEGLAGGASKAE